jgi:GNAT superfamily N-acetyltransferase
MDVSIRRVGIADAVQLAELLRGMGWFDALRSLTIEGLVAQVEKRIRQCLADDSHSVYVALRSEGKIAGYGSVHWLPYLFMAGPEGYVSELFVGAEARGQGVGRQLLGAIESEARARGCQRLSLINLRNRESYQRQFYPKTGWTERTEAANFIYALT